MSLIDYIIIFIYAVVVICIGIIAGRKEKNTDDYFLGSRKMPWWAVLISIYATALSALTFIGVPGAAFSGDFLYLQLAFGDLVGRILIALLLLTAYYKNKIFTVYELLGRRFGERTRDCGTIFFIITRLLASGVRIAGCAIALAVIFEIPLNAAIVFICITALIYTMLGGIKAVIWTDTIQFILFITAACIALTTVIMYLPDGLHSFIKIGNDFNKFKIFHLSFSKGAADYWLNLSNSKSFIAGFLFGCFTTFAALGTDQDLVQRMLTCEKVKQSQRAIIGSAILNFPVTLLFLSVGAALFVYYKVHPDIYVTHLINIKRTDFIFPYFIKTVLSPGLKGILIAGLLAAAMSSLDSALNALSTTAYIDFYKRYIKKNLSEENALKVSKYFVIIFTILLSGIAMLFGNTESILWFGFRIIGYTYGPMLGIFLLAVLTKKRGRDLFNVFAMTSSVFVVIFLTSDLNSTLISLRLSMGLQKIAWPWAIIIGTFWTFGIGIIVPGAKKKNI